MILYPSPNKSIYVPSIFSACSLIDVSVLSYPFAGAINLWGWGVLRQTVRLPPLRLGFDSLWLSVEIFHASKHLCGMLAQPILDETLAAALSLGVRIFAGVCQIR